MNTLSAIYGCFVGAQNRLYDSGVFTAHRLSGPVISVGNLSVGGAGKTPFVILLGELLKQRGIEFDVLSRGYGRKTSGVLQVDPDGSPQQFGDEPLLIARRRLCPVVVGESRYQAGLFAERKHGQRLHILDDGFQHRKLARDFDIVLLTPEDFQDHLLPSGRLREPSSSLNRADAAVLMSETAFPAHLHKTVWRVRRAIEISDVPHRPVAFCGIARPRRFIEDLRTAGVAIAVEQFYRDHHAYTSADVRQLLELRDRNGADGFVTTEKDSINLGPHLAKLAPIVIARVCMELENSADALDTILRVIGERRPSA